MDVLKKAVQKAIENDLVTIKSSQLWDGDCYSYSVYSGSELLCRTYDANEASQVRINIEEGRKKIITDPQRIKDIKDLAFVQWNYEGNSVIPSAARGNEISFEYQDMNITNPWIDESARFELTDAKAVETYGEENIGKFILSVSDFMSAFSIIQKTLHDPSFRKKAGLEDPVKHKHKKTR